MEWEASQGSNQQVPAVFKCKLRVGRCQLSTDVHVMNEPVSSEQRVSFDWHIHLGESVVKALICANWDADICYLDASLKGTASSVADRPSCCSSFPAALDSGHADCLPYWHGAAAALVNDYSPGGGRKQLERLVQPPSAEADSSDCLEYVDQQGFPWDARVCSDNPLADRPSCCSSFAAALDSGHADCLRHWHGALAAMGEASLNGKEERS
ncbi:g11873 [Coccomyxa elongata]